MLNLREHKKDLIFWAFIQVNLFLLLLIFFLKTNKDLIVLAFTPLVSYFMAIWGGKIRGKLKFYATYWFEYLIYISTLFILFLGAWFLIPKHLSYLKIYAFLIFSAIGWYFTVNVLKVYKNSKKFFS